MELLNVRGVGYRLATKNKATSQRLVALFCGKTGARLTPLCHIIENQTIKALTVFRFVKLHAQVATQHRDL